MKWSLDLLKRVVCFGVPDHHSLPKSDLANSNHLTAWDIHIHEWSSLFSSLYHPPSTAPKAPLGSLSVSRHRPFFVRMWAEPALRGLYRRMRGWSSGAKCRGNSKRGKTLVPPWSSSLFGVPNSKAVADSDRSWVLPCFDGFLDTKMVKRYRSHWAKVF